MGTGKSSLTSILVERLVQAPDGIIASFYCFKKIDEKAQQAMQRKKVVNVVRSLLGQSAVSTDGASVYEGVKKSQTRFAIAIDALDECEDYDELLKLLHTLSATKNVRLFFSSRLEVNARSIFTAARGISILSQNSADIERFLNVETPRRRDGCDITDSQVSALRAILTSRANGMFLWVKIQVNLFLDLIKSRRARLEFDIALKLAALKYFTALGEELLNVAYDDGYTPNGINEDQKTALNITIRASNEDMMRELVNHGSVVRPSDVVAGWRSESLL
ncbi:hypothetical protein S40285_10724 [Stachybotrys chlorohalonatus IBT 40285]|uniref:Nephrocystin 3-like N-terminal domain-containing protein n=1 Tax=Stachybotrys chlorohalonatus (strain IBT 40285) TaxID=1283841 RepID=A0A084QYI6_STAC4|nr:hypothetical protein S40285_10724 [Stachybotrys chlorohalonata IBT 40285]